MINALVLAGGGVAGIAWELGVLRGIADVDPSLAARILAADLVVGTSAGSTVAAQITSGVDLDELYAVQLRPDSAEIQVDVDQESLFAAFGAAVAGASGAEDARRRVGALARSTETVDPRVRLAVIDARLPVKHWPDRRMLLPAVDAESGEVAVFTRASGVSLVDAVAASCAVPGVWPPVAIDGHHYIDGGVRSTTNADLAAGAERVLVVNPTLADAPQPWGDLDAEIATLAPARVHVISADQASVEAFGDNPLSPATRAPSARAGRAVGAATAAAVAAVWS
ncbi:patatin-like phospholipase family protein [Micromonospora sp. WMMD812]|uniref:patatin-like phospholipase family protein n=1 Tax=Micromonospora sp. WMMD812 TaxID=3015152 RepID=UPI00248CCCC7|nr:patatin-like phospholipase family protein [Micromonospora sp. WMMD812]WBB68525.1 patatin-like phospholipase family protein [Micromonospora sp. WMMD812]